MAVLLIHLYLMKCLPALVQKTRGNKILASKIDNSFESLSHNLLPKDTPAKSSSGGIVRVFLVILILEWEEFDAICLE